MRINRVGGSVCRRTRTGAAFAVIVSCLLFSSMSSRAQETLYDCLDKSGYSCNYTIEVPKLQKAPAFFKFQTRISQAKLPVGDVVFEKVFVNVKRGDAALCQETFSQVPVRDSVLNLEIGRTMDCKLATILAQNDDLKFQICIGNQENCLKPVALSSVPFAVKSTYANTAAAADVANTAAQCHYAHRMSADAAMFKSQKLGVGYYDFHTPDIGAVQGLIDMYDTTAWSQSYEDGGFIQWMQLDTESGNLHICSQYSDDTNRWMGRLDEVVIHSAMTKTFGHMVVGGDPAYTHENDDGTIHPFPERSLYVERGMTVEGKGYFADDVIMKSDSDLEPRRFEYHHELLGQGVSNFLNTVNVGRNPLTENDESAYDQAVAGAPENVMNVNHWMKVNGNSQYYANANFYNNVTFENATTRVANTSQLNVDGLSIFSNETNFNGKANFNGEAEFFNKAIFHDIDIVGDVSNVNDPNSIGNNEIDNNDHFEFFNGVEIYNDDPYGPIPLNAINQQNFVPAIQGENSYGVAIRGLSDNGYGIVGYCRDPSMGCTGVYGASYYGVAVEGYSSNGVGGHFRSGVDEEVSDDASTYRAPINIGYLKDNSVTNGGPSTFYGENAGDVWIDRVGGISTTYRLCLRTDANEKVCVTMNEYTPVP